MLRLKLCSWLRRRTRRLIGRSSRRACKAFCIKYERVGHGRQLARLPRVLYHNRMFLARFPYLFQRVRTATAVFAYVCLVIVWLSHQGRD